MLFSFYEMCACSKLSQWILYLRTRHEEMSGIENGDPSSSIVCREEG